MVGALLVGAAVARSLAYAWEVPAIGVHHMEGHLLAPLLEKDPPDFPFVALLVSGGHTLLADVHGVGQYELLGSSLDDAAGEAFDKTAKLLGLGYPGGPQLAALAEQGRPGRLSVSASADRATRSRLQFQRPENGGRRGTCATMGRSTTRREPMPHAGSRKRSSIRS